MSFHLKLVIKAVVRFIWSVLLWQLVNTQSMCLTSACCGLCAGINRFKLSIFFLLGYSKIKMQYIFCSTSGSFLHTLLLLYAFFVEYQIAFLKTCHASRIYIY